jgi:hypothetical protein
MDWLLLLVSIPIVFSLGFTLGALLASKDHE